jgi:hypothetical protein
MTLDFLWGAARIGPMRVSGANLMLDTSWSAQ